MISSTRRISRPNTCISTGRVVPSQSAKTVTWRGVSLLSVGSIDPGTNPRDRGPGGSAAELEEQGRISCAVDEGETAGLAWAKAPCSVLSRALINTDTPLRRVGARKRRQAGA
jgi:hypothetical protein